MNGIVPEVPTSGAEAEVRSSREDSSFTQSSALQFSPSSTDGKPMVSSSTSDWRPTQSTTSAIKWKPPASASTEGKSITAPNQPSSDWNRTVSCVSKKNSPVTSVNSNPAPPTMSEWKPVQVVTTSSVRVNTPARLEEETKSAAWKNFQVSDDSSSDGFTKSASPNSKAEPIDTTIFDKELTEV